MILHPRPDGQQLSKKALKKQQKDAEKAAKKAAHKQQAEQKQDAGAVSNLVFILTHEQYFHCLIP